MKFRTTHLIAEWAARFSWEGGARVFIPGSYRKVSESCAYSSWHSKRGRSLRPATCLWYVLASKNELVPPREVW